MIGWKQGYTLDRNYLVLIKLYIRDDAVINLKDTSSGEASYCNKAKVLDITSHDGKVHIKIAVSMKDCSFKYYVGKTVTAQNDPGIGSEPGIYFFRTKQEAIDYVY